MSKFQALTRNTLQAQPRGNAKTPFGLTSPSPFRFLSSSFPRLCVCVCVWEVQIPQYLSLFAHPLLNKPINQKNQEVQQDLIHQNNQPHHFHPHHQSSLSETTFLVQLKRTPSHHRHHQIISYHSNSKWQTNNTPTSSASLCPAAAAPEL